MQLIMAGVNPQIPEVNEKLAFKNICP